MAVDPTFSTNNYNKPKVLTEIETTVNNVLALLFGKPGFYPSIPDLGMDIKQYLYKFEDDINPDEIKTILARQCEDFVPDIQSGDLDVYVTNYNGQSALVFILPIITDQKSVSVALGVTLNEKGEMVYNFVEDIENKQIVS